MLRPSLYTFVFVSVTIITLIPNHGTAYILCAYCNVNWVCCKTRENKDSSWGQNERGPIISHQSPPNNGGTASSISYFLWGEGQNVCACWNSLFYTCLSLIIFDTKATWVRETKKLLWPKPYMLGKDGSEDDERGKEPVVALKQPSKERNAWEDGE